MWITRAEVGYANIVSTQICIEYADRAPASAGISRYVAYLTVRLSSCLHSPPVLLFSSIAFSIRSLLYYSVKTKSSFPLFLSLLPQRVLMFTRLCRRRTHLPITSNLNLRNLRWGAPIGYLTIT